MNATATAPANRQIAPEVLRAETSCILLSMHLNRIDTKQGAEVDLHYLALVLCEFSRRDMTAQKQELFATCTQLVASSVALSQREVALGALEKMFNETDAFIIGYREGQISDDNLDDTLCGCFGFAQLISDNLSRIASHLGLWINWFSNHEPKPANHWTVKSE